MLTTHYCLSALHPSIHPPTPSTRSIHRGAAVFVEGSAAAGVEDVAFEGMHFDQVSGNGIMFSNAVSGSAVRACVFEKVGDSAIAMLGSTKLMLGTKGNGLFPTANTIEANLVDTVGVYGKQTSAYFKGKARANIVRHNVFMNGPRAGVNFVSRPHTRVLHAFLSSASPFAPSAFLPHAHYSLPCALHPSIQPPMHPLIHPYIHLLPFRHNLERRHGRR